jgi:hypothetical protein
MMPWALARPLLKERRENSLIDIEVKLQMKTKITCDVVEYPMKKIRPFKISTDPTHSLGVWKEISEVVIPFVLKGAGTW